MAFPQASIDQRQTERRILRVRAIASVANLAYDVRTENVSVGGLAIRMPVPLPTKTTVQVTFMMFAGSRPANITLTAAVIHTLLSGDSWLTGLSVTRVAEDHRKILADYCGNRI
jgi:PilZ domain